jgi:hypothetical protein
MAVRANCDQIIHEQIIELEEALVLKAYAVPPKSKEAESILYDYRRNPYQNTRPMLDNFLLFLEMNSVQPMSLRAIPLYELSWLLGNFNIQNPNALGENASKMLNYILKATNERIKTDRNYIFKNLPSTPPNPKFSTYKKWLQLAEDGEPIPHIKAGKFEKIISIIALMTERYSIGAKFYTPLTAQLFPEIRNNIPVLEIDIDNPPPINVNDLKLAIVGDIGTVDMPRPMPFITVNFPAVMERIKQNMEAFIDHAGMYRVRNINISYPKTQAVLMVIAKNSKCHYGELPIPRLEPFLEEVKNRRRVLGVNF